MANEQIEWPKKTRELQNPSVDSTRWDGFKFRDDDIVIAGHPKSGTTLTLQIASQLVLGAPDRLTTGGDVPWPEWQPWQPTIPIAAAMNAAEAITHRRLLKTHLPLDTLVFSPKAKYIYVARDPRDVAWSAHNHLAGLVDEIWQSDSSWRPQGDERDYYLQFLRTNVIMPTYGDYWDNVRSWWKARALPNLLLVHYIDLKADLAGEIERIAGFLGIEIEAAGLHTVIEHCSFSYMRAQHAMHPPPDQRFYKEGWQFFNKGTNGRWRDVLSAEEIARCDAVAVQKLGPECAHWLKTGELPA